MKFCNNFTRTNMNLIVRKFSRQFHGNEAYGAYCWEPRYNILENEVSWNKNLMMNDWK